MSIFGTCRPNRILVGAVSIFQVCTHHVMLHEVHAANLSRSGDARDCHSDSYFVLEFSAKFSFSTWRGNE